MEPAAVLSILLTAKGVTETSMTLRKVQAEAEKTAGATTRLEQRFSRLDNTVGDFNRSMMGLRNVVSIVKWPALIAGAGMAAQAIGAVGGAAAATGAALAPLTGAGAGVAGMYVAVGQGAGVAKLAMGDVTKAMGGNAQAMKRLNPQQRAFVASLKSAQQEVQGLSQAAGAGMFPGLTKAVNNLMPLMNRLKPVVQATGQALGDMAVGASKMLASMGGALSRIGQNNIGVLKNLGSAATFLGHAFIEVLDAARPLTTWMSALVKRGAAWIDSQVQAARASGKLAAFFEKTKAVMTTLGHTLANFGVGLFNVFKGGTSLGNSFLQSLEKLSKRFREWTESARGQQSIKKFFQDAREPAYQIFKLIGAVASAFARLAKPGPETSKMLQGLRQIVPVLESVIKSTTQAFGPAIVAALTNVVKLFGALAGTSAPLTLAVRAIGWLAGVMASLLKNTPGLQTMAVTVIGLGGAWKVFQFALRPLVSLLGPIVSGVSAVTGAISAQAAMANMSSFAFIRMRAAQIASAAAARVAAAAQWLLNVAMTANPILLIVAALAAIGAAFYVLYTRVKPVRDAINWLWGALKDVAGWIMRNWQTVLAALAGPVGLAVLMIIKHGDDILAFFTSLPGKVAGLLRSAWGAIWSAAVWLFGAVASAVRATWGAISGAVGWVIGNVVGGVKVAWNALYGAGRWVFEGFGKGLQAAWGFIAGIVKWVVDHVVSTVSSVWNAMFNAGKFILGAIGSGIKSVADTVMNILKGFVETLLKPINIVLHAIGVGEIHPFGKGGGGGGQKSAPNAYEMYAQGGMVNKPMAIVGEEAPRHPEVVIATNPAYRERNLGLFAQAGRMLGIPGFAQGGTVTASMYTDHGPGAFGIVRDVQAQPGFAELQMGHALGNLKPGTKITVAYGGKKITVPKVDIGLGGPGIGGYTRAIDLTSPAASALNFPGLANVNWALGGGGGLLSAIPGVLAGALETMIPGLGMVLDAADAAKKLVGKLPKAPKLPGFLERLPQFMLDKTTGWIKKKVGGLFGGLGGPASHLGTMRPSWSSLDALAGSLGLRVTSGLRAGDVGSYHGSGRAHDYADGAAQMLRFAQSVAGGYGGSLQELIHTPLGWGIKRGRRVDQNQVYGSVLGQHYNHVHVAFRKGGVFGPEYAGQFGAGGAVTASSPTLALFGERGAETAFFVPHFQSGGWTGAANAAQKAASASPPPGLTDPVAAAARAGFAVAGGGGGGGGTPVALTSGWRTLLGIPPLPKLAGKAGNTPAAARQVNAQISGLKAQIGGLDSEFTALDGFFQAPASYLTPTGDIDQQAIQTRVAQLVQLLAVRQRIFDIWSRIVALHERLVQTNKNIVARARKTLQNANTMIKRLQNALRGTKGKQRTSISRQLTNARNTAKTAQGQIDQYSANATSAAGDVAAAMSDRDTAWIQLLTLRNEKASVLGTKAQPVVAAAEQVPGVGETTGATDQAAQLQAQLQLMTQLATVSAQRAAVSETTLKTLQVPFAGKFAAGGIATATSPTLALFGERGPETAVFVPGTGPVGGSAHIEVHNHFPPGLGFLRDQIRTEVVQVTRNQTRLPMRGLPGSG